jgi:hypothetical protein
MAWLIPIMSTGMGIVGSGLSAAGSIAASGALGLGSIFVESAVKALADATVRGGLKKAI